MAASQGLLRLEVDGIPHWVQVKAIQEEGGLNFYFLHGIPESTLLAPVYSSTQQAALWGGGLLLGFLGVGILLDKALSRPLRRLTQIAEQFVHSGIPALASMDPGPIQEVQTLAKAWQQAAANQQALLDRLWQQQQYCAVVEQQTELICRFRPDTSITYANPAYLRFFGRSAEETIGRRWRDSLPPEEREAVLQALAVLTPEHPFHRSEREYPGEDGQSRWVSWVDRGIFDSQGQLVEILSVGREITEQKRAQQQLEALNRELEAQVPLCTAQLEQALRFEAVLRSLSGQMVASLKEGEILEEVVKSLAEALNLTGCHIFLTSADGSSCGSGLALFQRRRIPPPLTTLSLGTCCTPTPCPGKSTGVVKEAGAGYTSWLAPFETTKSGWGSCCWSGSRSFPKPRDNWPIRWSTCAPWPCARPVCTRRPGPR
jgi:PAS domain S-box-containing protein